MTKEPLRRACIRWERSRACPSWSHWRTGLGSPWMGQSSMAELPWMKVWDMWASPLSTGGSAETSITYMVRTLEKRTWTSLLHKFTSDTDKRHRPDGTHAVFSDAHKCTGITCSHIFNDEGAPASLIHSGTWNQWNVLTPKQTFKTEVTSGLLPLWGLLLTVQEMTGDGVPWAWQDKARLWPLFKVTSPGSSLKAGLMLTARRLSCLADPAALVATQVNAPASAGCVKEPELKWCAAEQRNGADQQTNLSPFDDQLSWSQDGVFAGKIGHWGSILFPRYSGLRRSLSGTGQQSLKALNNRQLCLYRRNQRWD